MKLYAVLVLASLSFGLARAETGRVSYYSEGTRTASGERLNRSGNTCAHRRHPFNSLLRVTTRVGTVVCRVNDRGPFVRGRVLDVVKGLAAPLGLLHAGVLPATVVRVQ